jgi:hypothetical protein
MFVLVDVGIEDYLQSKVKLEIGKMEVYPGVHTNRSHFSNAMSIQHYVTLMHTQ